MTIERLSSSSDFSGICQAIVPSEWDALNALLPLSEKALREMATNPTYLFLIARVDEKIAGTLLALILLKTDGSKWLYVDELDTHPAYRRQGVATALMQEAFSCARAEGAQEAWLGTEPANDPANAFYASLHPTETSDFTGYTFDISSEHHHA